MKIVMKEYNYLDSFKDKDIYTFEEIMDKVQELESTIYKLNEEIEKLTREPEDKETWEYDRGE